MTEPNSSQSNSNADPVVASVASLAALNERWPAIAAARSEIATELRQMSRDLPGETSKQLRLISRWFQGTAGFDEAVKRPDVFAICLPLFKSGKTDFSSEDITEAARTGLRSLIRNASSSRRWIRTLIYPILLFSATIGLALGFSFWIAPEFETMFAEFGIELPSMTKLVFGLARFMRQMGWILAALFFAGLVLSWLSSFWGRNNRAFGLSWLDQQLMSTRNAVASWAWHLSLLLDAGVSQNDAISTAGSASGESWLQRKSRLWAKRSPTATSGPFFASRKLQMMNYAIQLPQSAGQISLLQEIATYYWDRNRSVGDWWIHWLVGFIIAVVAFAIIMIVFALFFPLVAIVSGLSGGGLW